MREKIKIILGIVVAVILLLLCGLVAYNATRANFDEVKHPVATFEIQDYGNVKVELYPEYAPNTVANFIALIDAGYFNNKSIFGKDDVCVYMGRDTNEDAKKPTVSLIDDSVEVDSEDDYEYEINGEFIANNFNDNTLRHEKGILSLNRSDYSTYGLTQEGYNSGNAQFSIMMTNDCSNLNGVYCAFGRVIEGLDIIEKIYNESEVVVNEEETEEGGIKEFATMPVMTNVSIEKNGVNFIKPVVHKAFDIQQYINDLYNNYYFE